MCFPGWSDPAVFAGLLGSGGSYRVVVDERAVSGGYYEEGTLIWRSRWLTARGAVECREALAYPGDKDRAILLRRVEAIDTAVDVTISVELATEYGRRALGSWSRRPDCWLATHGRTTARWSGAPEARAVRGSGGNRIELKLHLRAGEHRDLVLELAYDGALPDLPDPKRCWQRTEETWAAVVPPCDGVVAARDVRRAAAVLRGMTSPDGGTVAALTTSLPEGGDNARNYDYRYSWIRDTCYVGHAGAALPGGEMILDDAVRWVGERLRSDGPETMPAYTVEGCPIPLPRPLKVPGYPGGTDIVGNVVRDQFQLDIFGEALLLFAEAATQQRLDADGWRAAEIAASVIADRFALPECGIWEIGQRLWTHSRLIAVAGLRAICAAGAPPALTTRALPLADHLLAEVSRTSLHRSGRFMRAPDDERVDASLLLAEIRGALPSEDPRSRATRAAVVEELVDDDYIYRYAHEGRSLGEAEGAFLVCNFWMALACFRAGELCEGIRWFERARSSCGSPGLFSEEYDVAEHQLRGNLPQAFVHALLIEAAVAQGPR